MAACGGDANEVVPSLFLGSLEAAHNKEWLRRHNITAIVNVSESAYAPPPSVVYIHAPLRDGNEKDLAPSFEKVYPVMRAVSASNQYGTLKPPPAMLVHCKHGRSRSAAVVLMYLMRWYREPLSHAFATVRAARPTVLLPVLPFQMQLTAFERTEFGVEANSVASWAGAMQAGGGVKRHRTRAATRGDQ